MIRENLAAWAPWIAFAGLMLVGLVWMLWDLHVAPYLLPREDVEREADEIMANFADPADEAFQREWRAWHRCEGPEQGRWRRVRRIIQRRQWEQQSKPGNHPPS